MDVQLIRQLHLRAFQPQGLLLGSLVLGMLLSLPAQGFFGIEHDVSRLGTDSEGIQDDTMRDGELNNEMAGYEHLDFIGGGDSLSGAVFSAGGPAGVSLLASYGYLRAEASVGGATGQAFAGVTTHSLGGLLEAYGRAVFEDKVTITAPGMDGLPGTFTAHFMFDPHIVVDGFVVPDDQPPGGVLDAIIEASLSASWRLNEVRSSYRAWYSLTSVDVDTFNDFPEEEITVQVPFIYGEEFEIRFRINVASLIAVSENGFAQGRAVGSFPGSMQWLGMTGLPADATVTGQADWTSAAPIPDAEDDPPTDNGSGGNGSNQGGSKKSGGALFASLPWLLGLLYFVRFRATRMGKAKTD